MVKKIWYSFIDFSSNEINFGRSPYGLDKNIRKFEIKLLIMKFDRVVFSIEIDKLFFYFY